jgi:hypothetical protein
VAVAAEGTATLSFNVFSAFTGVVSSLSSGLVSTDTVVLVDPTTGRVIPNVAGTRLNGTAIFEIDNTAIASFVGAATTTTGTSNVSAGSATTRCGTVATNRTSTILGDFFGGCDSVSVKYRGVAPGSTNITATFLPDLPGAFGGPEVRGVAGGLGTGAGNIQALLGGFTITNSITRQLEVVGVGPATTQRLVPGCNNVVAPANETVQQVAARVDPTSAVISIWKQVPGTTQFTGAAIGGNVPAGVSNLTNVTALDAIFICVNAAATYRLT